MNKVFAMPHEGNTLKVIGFASIRRVVALRTSIVQYQFTKLLKQSVHFPPALLDSQSLLRPETINIIEYAALTFPVKIQAIDNAKMCDQFERQWACVRLEYRSILMCEVRFPLQQ
jgi:hypothetical protein